jgi:hypothetical protein
MTDLKTRIESFFHNLTFFSQDVPSSSMSVLRACTTPRPRLTTLLWSPTLSVPRASPSTAGCPRVETNRLRYNVPRTRVGREERGREEPGDSGPI